MLSYIFLTRDKTDGQEIFHPSELDKENSQYEILLPGDTEPHRLMIDSLAMGGRELLKRKTRSPSVFRNDAPLINRSVKQIYEAKTDL